MLKDNPIKIIKCGDIEIPVEYLKQTTVNVNGDDYIRLQQENQQLKNNINKLQKELNEENFQCSKYAIKINDLKENNKQLKDNWNKLKEYIEKDYDFYDKLIAPKYGCAMGALRRIKDKMQKLEQGSDSDE